MTISRRGFLSTMGLGAPAVIAASVIPAAGDGGASLQPGKLFDRVDTKGFHWADRALGVKKKYGSLISSEPGMPGEPLWAKHCQAGGSWRVYLDGEDQYWFVAASEKEGWVLREVSVEDPSGIPVGNGRREVPVLNSVTNEWVMEVVYGDVDIRALNPTDT